jgi:hypothetical protein
MRALRALQLHHHQRARVPLVRQRVRMGADALAQRRRMLLQAQVQPFSAQLFYQRRWTLQAKGAISGPNGAPYQ